MLYFDRQLTHWDEPLVVSANLLWETSEPGPPEEGDRVRVIADGTQLRRIMAEDSSESVLAIVSDNIGIIDHIFPHASWRHIVDEVFHGMIVVRFDAIFPWGTDWLHVPLDRWDEFLTIESRA